jgi:putative transposase
MKMCKVMLVNRNGYYSWLQSKPSARSIENNKILCEIIKIHKAINGIYGSPSIHAELKNNGLKCSRPRVARLMSLNNISSKIKRKFKVTTNSNHTHGICSNVLKTAPKASNINEQWVADITYIRTEEGWLYLSAIMDLYSRKIISWVTSKSLSKEIVTRAIWNALKTRRVSLEIKTIFHSDRGVQYASKATKNILKQNNITQSMSGKGSCYDNAAMESFFHTLKVQHVYHHKYKTRDEARASIFWYIELFYNTRRLHSSLDYLSPENFERKMLKEFKKIG